MDRRRDNVYSRVSLQSAPPLIHLAAAAGLKPSDTQR